MLVLEQADKRDERQIAAFLLPSSPTADNLLRFSQYFYESRSDLLEATNYGIVAQQLHYHEGTDQVSSVDTLIFDASDRYSQSYTWQLTHGEQGARTIWDFSLERDQLKVRLAKTDKMGRLIDSSQLETEPEIAEAWEQFHTLLTDPGTINYEQELREQREQAFIDELDFLLSHMVSYSYTDYIDPTPVTYNYTSQLTGEAYDKHKAAIRANIRRIGFTALSKSIPDISRPDVQRPIQVNFRGSNEAEFEAVDSHHQEQLFVLGTS